MTVRILHGDCRDVLKTLPDESVHCCVTSPPYFGLRDYGVSGQIGLEQTPDAFVAELVAVFREVRRVLRNDGTLWLNIGDSYAGSWGAQGRSGWNGDGKHGYIGSISATQIDAHPKRAKQTGTIRTPGVKPKDLYGIPWLLAFALRAEGWYLRQDIIWSKPNPMPESVRDRCTKAHEYLFLLSKSERYYFDSEAMQEPADSTNRWAVAGAPVPGKPAQSRSRDSAPPRHAAAGSTQDGLNEAGRAGTRNKRSVWTVATEPFRDAHFATFPPALIEPCIAAGCPMGGIVLDPFGGAGTTGLVADRLQRDAILIELNPAYADIAQRRITGDAPLFAEVAS